MSTEVAIIAADHYTYQSGWQDELQDIASDIETNWNDDLGGHRSISVDAPPIYGHTDSVATPSSDQTPEDYRDDIRATVAYSTDLYDSYDSVIVRTDVDMGDTTGVAYIGDTDDFDSEDSGQAAGSSYGLGIVFQTPTPGLTSYHEMLHTYGALHVHGQHTEDWKGSGEDSPICSWVVSECNDETNHNKTKWELSPCTRDVVSGYIDNHSLY